MTPNQITAVAATVRNLLHDGHRQHLTPRADARTYAVTVFYDHARGATVTTRWNEPEGPPVTLSAYIYPDGSITDRPAEWPHANTESHTSTIPPAVLTDCVVCDGAGCEWCPRVGGLA